MGYHHRWLLGCTAGQSEKGAKSMWWKCVTLVLPSCLLSSTSSLLCPVHAGVTCPVAPAKPTVPLGPFGESSKAPALPCPHGVLQSLAEIPGATETHSLWNVPPPRQPLYGALPSAHPSSHKLSGKVHVAKQRGMLAGSRETRRALAPERLQDAALLWGRAARTEWGR